MKENPGTFIINPHEPGEQMSVMVTGLGRSGTTMVSRILSALGLFMGERLSRGTNEDKDFRNIIKKGSLTAFEELCRERDANFDKWGFKYPGARHSLGELVQAMRSPRLIITSRDPLATAMRAATATRADILPTFEQGLRRMLRLVESVAQVECPVLFLSYEKALTRPSQCVAAVASFCGINADDQTLDRATGTIRNGDTTYLA